MMPLVQVALEQTEPYSFAQPTVMPLGAATWSQGFKVITTPTVRSSAGAERAPIVTVVSRAEAKGTQIVAVSSHPRFGSKVITTPKVATGSGIELET